MIGISSPDPSLWTYSRFRDALARIDPDLPEDEMLACRALHVFGDERLAIYYAPFEYVNDEARIILMGITPGRRQLWEACMAANRAIARGASDDEVLREANSSGSFAGPMRTNLVRMLDDVGIARRLGVASCSSLFSDDAKLVFSTSAVIFPVFVRGRNYAGHSPRILVEPILRRIVEDVTLPGLARAPQALVIPLGKAASEVVEHYGTAGKLDLRRCLIGFPHPSGGNGHRVRVFDQNREALKRRIDDWFGDKT